MILDIISPKKEKKTEKEKLRYAFLIAARNEEKVIGSLLQSLNEQDYPKELYDVFVVAHNCTDNTAEVAKSYGAKVLIRNSETERYKGNAVQYGVNCIFNDYPDKYDGICMFDADNIAGKSFLTETNKAMSNGSEITQGYRMSKNYYSNWISKLFGMFWLGMVHCQCLPLNRLGLPCTINGTGFAVKTDILKKTGWDTKTMLEDVEFSLLRIMDGYNIELVRDAVFYDEQPTQFSVAWKQRKRWSVGGTICLKKYFKQVVHYTFHGGKLRGVKILFDLMTNVALCCAVFADLLRTIAFIVEGTPFYFLPIMVLRDLSIGWLIMFAMPLGIILAARLPFWKNLTTAILLPGFLYISFIFAVYSFFTKKAEWVPIVHNDSTTIDDLEKK